MIYILTLTYNGCDKLTKLKESLFPAMDGLDWFWMIKNNGTKDNTSEVVSTWGDKVKLFEYKGNTLNFSACNNYLFNAAKPSDKDIVILMNDDVIFRDTQSIRKMIDILEHDNTVGVVGARMLYTDTNKIQHCGVVFDNNHHMPIHFRSGEESNSSDKLDRTYQVVTGAVLVTKAEYYKNVYDKNKSSIKGMNENYHWAFDDVDLCLSIKYNMEKKIVYCGGTDIYHEESPTLKKNPVNKLFLTHNVSYLKGRWTNRYILDKNSYAADPKHNLYRK